MGTFLGHEHTAAGAHAQHPACLPEKVNGLADGFGVCQFHGLADGFQAILRIEGWLNTYTVTLADGTVIPAEEVWFDWGVMDSRLYFTYKTTTQFRTFKTDTFEFDKEMIYSFYFVLYDKGESGMFGVRTNLSDTMVALKTYEETDG